MIIGLFPKLRRKLQKARALRDTSILMRVELAVRVIATALICVSICAASTMPVSSRHIEITAKRFSFEPAEITVHRGETVELVLKSSDVPHGLRIRELNIDLRTQKGKSASAIISPQKVGTFVGHCSVFCGSGHGKMTLTVRVVG